MTFPEVQFVASPDVGAAVRFDFNQAGSWSTDQIWPAHDGVSLGAPTLEGDPDGIGTEYGFRRLSFDLIIVGTHASAATKVSALAKELTRQTNWLRVRMTPTSVPVWFKTYRSAPSALNFEHVYASDDVTRNTFGVSIELDAGPFAVGAEVTIGPVTVNNNPAAGTNPMIYTLPTIVGDFAAPARVELAGDSVQLNPSPTLAVAPGAPMVVSIGTGDGGTAGTDCGAAVANAAYSGGSYRPVTFATNAGLVQRLSVSTPSAPPPGRYLVFVRVARSDTSSKFSLRLQNDGLVVGKTVSMDRAPSLSAGYAQWVNLGSFSFPAFLSDAFVPSGNTTSLALDVARVSGTGQLNLDAFFLVPVELAGETGTVITSLIAYLAPFPDYVARWDGEGEYFQDYYLGKANASSPSSHAGGFVEVSPGRTNVFTLLRQTSSNVADTFIVSSAENTDVISVATHVTVSYRPRWLYLAAS